MKASRKAKNPNRGVVVSRGGRPSIIPDVRSVIRDAALGLFGERGFEASSIGDIATAAGVAKANVLYHFGSKEELWREAIDALFAEVDAFFAEHWPMNPDRSLAQLAEAVTIYLEACQRWPAYVQIYNLEGHADSWRTEWLADRHLRRHIESSRRFFNSYIAAGILPDIDPLYLQNMVAGGGQLMIGQYRLWRRAARTDATARDFAAAYVEALIAVMARPPA